MQTSRKSSEAISQYEYDTHIKAPAQSKVHDKLKSLVNMTNNFHKISKDKQAALMMLMEKLVPGSVCTRENIKVTVEKEHILIKDYIESMFPDITYDDAKKAFDEMYQDYRKIACNKE